MKASCVSDVAAEVKPWPKPDQADQRDKRPVNTLESFLFVVVLIHRPHRSFDVSFVFVDSDGNGLSSSRPLMPPFHSDHAKKSRR